MSVPALSPDGRRELMRELRPAQVEALDALLPTLRSYVQRRAPAEVVRAVAARMKQRAEEDFADWLLLLGAQTPEHAELSSLMAFYLDREPFTPRGVELPVHDRPDEVADREMGRALHRAWAAEMAATEVVAGRRQIEVSGIPVTLIRQVVMQPDEAGLVKKVSASSFVRIVTICLGAASGNEDGREWERWIKAARSNRRRHGTSGNLPDESNDDQDVPPLNI